MSNIVKWLLGISLCVFTKQSFAQNMFVPKSGFPLTQSVIYVDDSETELVKTSASLLQTAILLCCGVFSAAGAAGATGAAAAAAVAGAAADTAGAGRVAGGGVAP